MKSRSLTVLLAALLALMMTACGDASVDAGKDTPTTTAGDAVTTAAELSAPPAVYSFVSGKTTLYIGADPAILTALGEPQDKLEAASCVHEGFDRVYYYAGFEVNTQPTADGKEEIVSIYLTDDSNATPEGIRIGDKIDAVKTVYGEPLQISDTTGLYSYTKTDGGVSSTVNFLTDPDGSVISIYYNRYN